MSGRKAVFALHDTTTLKNFRPIVEALPESVSVEYLLLDRLFDESPGLPREELSPSREATDYVRAEFFQRINHRTRPGSLHVEAFQRVLEDRISPHVAYDLRRYWRDANPDLFVCGHDRLPFVKHVIRTCHERGVPSAVVQHGVQNLRPVASDSVLIDYLKPSVNPRLPRVEFVKRWLFHRYGAYIFCNPYLDAVYTMGDFFTEEVRALREDFPAFGKTAVVTAGYPEYDLREVTPYDPTVENCVFLSGWEYEAGEWDERTERLIAERLRRVAEVNGVDVTVRPHPKDSRAKVERFYGDFEISDVASLEADVERHDLVLTVFSTAVMLGVARGKPCGVIDLPWRQNDFGPFQDPHLVPVTESNVEVRERARERSRETQERYLRRYCFIPAVHGDAGNGTPGEYIASHLVSLSPSGGPGSAGRRRVGGKSNP
jgi:hypothetical protein